MGVAFKRAIRQIKQTVRWFHILLLTFSLALRFMCLCLSVLLPASLVDNTVMVSLSYFSMAH